jgi:hypothetical protein
LSFIFKRTFSKALAILLLVLFILWLFSPIIIKQIIKSKIPETWKIHSVDVGYPFYDGIEINNLSFGANAKEIVVEHVFIPFNGIKQIKISKIKIFLGKKVNKDNLQNSASYFENKIIPFFNPIETDYSLMVDNISIIDNDFELNGILTASTAASQFIGSVQYLKQNYPAEVNLIGLNGKQPLIFSTKIGSNQLLTIEYDWKAKNTPQALKIVGSIDNTLWSLIQKTKLISNDIVIQKPELAFELKIDWLKWPTLISELYDFEILGKIEFNFDAIETQGLKIDKNKIEVKALSNQQVLLSSSEDLLFSKTVGESEITFTNKKLINSELSIVGDKLKIDKTGELSTEWQQVKIKVINQEFSLNLLNNKIKALFLLKASASENKFIDKLFSKGVIDYQAEASVEIDDSKIKIDFNQNKIQLPEKINYQNWTALDVSFLINPFSAEINFNEMDFKNIIKNISLNGLLQTELSFDTDPARQRVEFSMNNRCKITKKEFILKAACESAPDEVSIETIDTLIELDLNQEDFKVSINSKKISAADWKFSKFLGKEFKIKNGDVSLEINLHSSFSQLLKLTTKNAIEILKIQTQIILNDSNFSFGKINFEAVQSEIATTRKGNVEIVLQAKNITLASGLQLNNLHGQYFHPVLNAKLKEAKGFLLDFSVFDGNVKLASDDFNFFNERYELQSNLSNINLEELFNWAEIEGLSGIGVIQGEFPVHVQSDGIFIKQGELSTQQAGIIRYSPNQSETQSDNIALAALQNFHYSELSLKIEELILYYNKDGSFIIPIRIVGRNPQSQFDNNFAINPVLKGVIPAKAWSHLITGNGDKK